MIPTVCVDLDGVLNQYSGWKGEDHFAEPRPWAAEFLRRLHVHNHVVVLTTRNDNATRTWLQEHGMSAYVSLVTNEKPPAAAYVDDRAVKFNGSFEEALTAVDEMTTDGPWWRG